MRDTVGSMPGAPEDFRTMLAYPFGWQQADGAAYGGATGKRIRPLLLLACLEAAGGNWQRGVYAAAAVEILHNFSLVHDDIQDHSEMRHNRETVWRVWGVPMAINVGDAMFTLSYRALEKLEGAGVPAVTRLDVLKVYNRTVLELTRGQHLDMYFETQPVVSVEAYLSMVRGKTAALLAGSAEIAALLAGQPAMTAARYAAFGLNVGVAFQVRDDILGIWGDPDRTGKSAASDLVARKKSVPVLYGLAHSEAFRALYAQPGQFTRADVDRALALLDEVGARDYALEQEQTYYTRSTDALDAAGPAVAGREMLMQLVTGLFKRSH